jgi:hypothetical protein
MKKIFVVGAFVLCFGAGRAQAQRVAGGSGGGVGGGNSGAAMAGSGGGASAIPGVTHSPLWVPPPNVSAKNDGAFVPSSFESYDKAIAMGQAELHTKQASVAETAKMAREQKATAEKAHLIVEQDVAGEPQLVAPKR